MILRIFRYRADYCGYIRSTRDARNGCSTSGPGRFGIALFCSATILQRPVFPVAPNDNAIWPYSVFCPRIVSLFEVLIGVVIQLRQLIGYHPRSNTTAVVSVNEPN
jgi:hypothetical protein